MASKSAESPLPAGMDPRHAIIVDLFSHHDIHKKFFDLCTALKKLETEIDQLHSIDNLHFLTTTCSLLLLVVIEAKQLPSVAALAEIILLATYPVNWLKNMAKQSRLIEQFERNKAQFLDIFYSLECAKYFDLALFKLNEDEYFRSIVEEIIQLLLFENYMRLFLATNIHLSGNTEKLSLNKVRKTQRDDVPTTQQFLATTPT